MSLVKATLCALIASLSIVGLASESTVSKHANSHNLKPQQGQKVLMKIKNFVEQKRPGINQISHTDGGTSTKDFTPLKVTEKMLWADESQFMAIQKAVITPWIEAFKKSNTTDFRKLLSLKYIGDRFNYALGSARITRGTIAEYQWKQNPMAISTSRMAKKDSSNYLKQFKNIHDFDLTTVAVVSPRQWRGKNLAIKKAELQVRYDLRGITKSGDRRQDRGPIKVIVALHGKTWKIESIQFWGMQTLASKSPAFKEVTASSGLNAIPEYQRIEAIRRGGYAMSLNDYDNDGILDMYVGAHGPGKLLKGQSDGTYKVAVNSGIADHSYVKSAIFSDFNNDGEKDLLIVAFVPHDPKVEGGDRRSDLILYKNLGKGKFSRVQSVKESTPSSYAMPATVADYNNDGLLDFYVGFPGVKDFTTLAKVPHKAGNKVQGIYTNLGNWKFGSKKTKLTETSISKFMDTQQIYPHSALSVDFDQDGDMDIVVVDDRGRLSPAYQNVGNGEFKQVAQQIGMVNRGYGMGVAAGDYDNDGRLDMLWTNVNFVAKDRLNFNRDQWHADSVPLLDNGGLKAFKGMGRGQFADVTKVLGLEYAGEGMAGVEFLDYNNDGHQDIYLANGLWSGTDEKQDLSSLFVHSTLKNDHGERVFMEIRHKTQSNFMDILASFKGDVYSGKLGGERPHHVATRLSVNHLSAKGFGQ